MSDLLARAPESTGVYVMRSATGEALYVGKALNLRQRVQQYLGLQDGREMVPRLVRELADIDYLLARSEKEALLLERQLIRRLKPRFNVRLRDGKEYLLVRIARRDPFPRFELVRRRRSDGADYFGPFTNGQAIREFIRLLARSYRVRSCSDRKFGQRQRPCMMFEMGWCSAPCQAGAGNEDYGARLREAMGLLSRSRQQARELVGEMMAQASRTERFEEAARYRDLLFALDSLWGAGTAVAGGVPAADIFALHHGPLGGAVFVLHVREGEVRDSSAFFEPALFSPQLCDLESLVYQFYADREVPPLVIAPFTKAVAAAELLGEESGRPVKLAAPRRGARLALWRLAQENAAQLYRERSEQAQGGLELMVELAEQLALPERVMVVECIDISSFHGGDAVGSVSVAREGIPAPSEYRSFTIREGGPDDLEMMAEVVRRRLEQLSASGEPRLILLDGGRTHLARMATLTGPAHRHLSLAAIAKARPEQGLYEERIYRPGLSLPVPIGADSRLMHFLCALRDEAHRFGVASHRRRRTKRQLDSPLLAVPGIGKERRLRLLRHFGSLKAVQAAAPVELAAVPGISPDLAERIFDHLHRQGKEGSND